MNQHSPFRKAVDGVVTADAGKVSGRQFLDALGLSSPEQRAERQREMIAQCIAAIERGDTYGWPPLLVAQCREQMDGKPLSELTNEKGEWL